MAPEPHLGPAQPIMTWSNSHPPADRTASAMDGAITASRGRSEVSGTGSAITPERYRCLSAGVKDGVVVMPPRPLVDIVRGMARMTGQPGAKTSR
jgi:hypothetical protein